MEGSSDSGWPKSDSNRELNTSLVSDRNPRDSSHASDFPIRRPKEIDSYEVGVDQFIRTGEYSDVSLRQWLDNPNRTVDALECLHIYRQIVEIVNLAHLQGIVVHNARPSCFIMSSFNHISFIESASCSDSGSDSFEAKELSSTSPNDLNNRQRQTTDCQLVSDSSSISFFGRRVEEEKEEEEKKQTFPMKQILVMETNWYTSPEEVAGAPSSCASDIYRLGVLLFELFCAYSSTEEKCRIMSSLRHRVLPPQLLLKWPKEASFCLWLLHPEPSSRPKIGELLQSEFLNEPRDNLEEREAALELRERIEEQELFLEFLLLIQQRKQEAADKLHNAISLLSSDINEVSKLQATLKKSSSSDFPSSDVIQNEESTTLSSRKRVRQGVQIHNEDESHTHLDENQKSEFQKENQDILSKNSRLMKNFKKLESAYFLTRCRQIKSQAKPLIRHSSISNSGRGSIVQIDRSSVNNSTSEDRYSEVNRQIGWVNPFLEGLCKYLSFSKLKVKADLKQGDLLNSSNLVCSLSFDRDGEFFAAAGVNKKIKVFECDGILNEDRDIHYPVVEMSSRSKLSSLCWNSYIKSQIASSNFEGVVQVWDVTRSQVFMEMREHERRVWSIDYSLTDPTMLASGSDDGSVKLWSINQGVSTGTIKTRANVCCVQFQSDSGRFLAFGSADHRIYYYDLRNSRVPLCTLVGHNKTVSYVKFVDSTNLVSASTDNTLKLWDLSMCSSRVIDGPLQSFTSHTNVKNFVGLSVCNGYIATGSETNEVFVYHKAFPMPALSFKFETTDPLSGQEVDAASQFISSVCWRGPSSTTLVGANSTGNIKILEMV